MAMSINTKTIKGHKYYYAFESKRVDGKPRIVFQKYLGKAERVVAAVQAAASPPKPERVVLTEFGAAAALHDVATRLRLVETIDSHVQKRNQGLSVGHYMEIAAINRCVLPKSKAKIGDWFESSALRRLIPAKKSHLSSKRFWDNMGHLNAERIAAIEQDLVARLVEEFKIDTQCLLFDTTNFFTFIDSFNDRSELAQRGKSKEKRSNLRIVGLALLVSADFHVPLLHQTYPGNRNDVREFAAVTEQLVQRYKALATTVDSVTLVFDKGNNSADNFAELARGPYHFVGSLKLDQCSDIAKIPLSDYTPLGHPRLYGVSAYRVTREVFNVQRTVLITYNEQLYLSQTQSLLNEIRKRTRHLNELGRKLTVRSQGGPRRGRVPTPDSVLEQARTLLKGQYVKDVIRLDVEEQDGVPILRYAIDHDALELVCRERFGKTVLFTDNDAWSSEDIVLAYRGQAGIENAFKIMKDPHFVSWAPMFHWTDEKVRVHAFYCVLALMLASLLQRELHHKGIDLSIPAMIEELAAIKEVALIYAAGTGLKSPQIVLSDHSELQQRLFDTLKLGRFSETPT